MDMSEQKTVRFFNWDVDKIIFENYLLASFYMPFFLVYLGYQNQSNPLLAVGEPTLITASLLILAAISWFGCAFTLLYTGYKSKRTWWLNR